MLVLSQTREFSKVVRLPQAERGARLIELRRVLAEEFPTEPMPKIGVIETGLEIIDCVEGGLRLGATTEISGSAGGNSLVLAALLSMLAKEQRLGALVDCGSFFDPGSFQPPALKRLLWVRCGLAAEAIKAADLLLRDGNLSVLMLDLQGADMRRLGTPASTWHRFQRVVEQGNMALAVFTPRPMVEGASVRISTEWRWDFKAIADRRMEILAGLQAHVSARRSMVMSTGPEVLTA
jgi:hypothetical protein